MAKTIKERAADLADAFIRLDQAAERWIDKKTANDYERVQVARNLSDRAVEWQQAVARTSKGGAR